MSTTSDVEGAAIRAAGRGLCRLLVTGALLCGTAALAAALPQGPPSEHEVKAVFLYNFAKFIGWPAEVFRDPSTPLVICVVGADPFGEVLDATTRDEKIEGRSITLRRLQIDGELKSCHILFASSSERRRLARLFEAIKGTSILTVGETEDFTRLGGIVQFTKERYRIGIQINIEAAEQAGLKVSSRLLSLAHVVGASSGSARSPR